MCDNEICKLKCILLRSKSNHMCSSPLFLCGLIGKKDKQKDYENDLLS